MIETSARHFWQYCLMARSDSLHHAHMGFFGLEPYASCANANVARMARDARIDALVFIDAVQSGVDT